MTATAPTPHAVSWNLTERCNLACSHCYLDASQRAEPASAELDREACLAVVDELAELNPQMVLILTGGEPLLHPHLHEIVGRAAAAGLMPVLGTNGTLIRPELAQSLADAGLRGWGVSLDSIEPTRHDELRRVEGAWRRAGRGLRVLRSLGLPFVVQSSIFSWNRHEIEALAGMALDLGAESLNYYFLVCTGRGQEVTDIGPDDYEEALREISRLQQSLGDRILLSAKCAPHQKRVLHQIDADSPFVAGYAGGCPAATHYFRIDPRGAISACPYIPSDAPADRAPLTERWALDPALQRLRDRTALGGRCGVCEYRDLCGGCRARALAATGDPLAEDPACRYRPGEGARASLAPERTFGGGVRFSMPWTEEAEGRLRAVPSFALAMVVPRIEEAARTAGEHEVTAERMKQVRSRMPGGR